MGTVNVEYKFSTLGLLSADPEFTILYSNSKYQIQNTTL